MFQVDVQTGWCMFQGGACFRVMFRQDGACFRMLHVSGWCMFQSDVQTG